MLVIFEKLDIEYTIILDFWSTFEIELSNVEIADEYFANRKKNFKCFGTKIQNGFHGLWTFSVPDLLLLRFFKRSGA